MQNNAFNYNSNEYGAASSRQRAPVNRNDSGLFNNQQRPKRGVHRNSVSDQYNTFNKEYNGQKSKTLYNGNIN